MPRLHLWIGASTADAAVRLSAQMLSTVIVARLVPAEDFGIALMVLSIVAIFSTFIGLPIEEALAQRRRLELAHVQSALFAALAVTVAVLVLAPVSGLILAEATGVREIAFWLPAATIFLIGEGPGAIVRAIARRHRRFVALSFCQSTSVVLATATAIAAAAMGNGILALILQRMLPGALLPLLSVAGAYVGRGTRTRSRSAFVRAAWHQARFKDLLRFSWLHLSDICVGAATPAVVAYTVNAVFGTATLGQLNIALRLVEPARQLVGGIGHNIVFSMLYRMQDAPARLVLAAAETVASVGVLAIPAFLGLAVCVPALLPLLVGPGWEGAQPLARALCVAAAISVPFGFLYSGYSALGRPQYGLIGSCLHLAVIVAGLGVIQVAGLAEGIGATMIAGEVVTAVLAIGFLVWIAGCAAGAPLTKAARIFAAAALMAATIDFARIQIGSIDSPFLELAAIVLCGALLYLLLLLAICQSCLKGPMPHRE